MQPRPNGHANPSPKYTIPQVAAMLGLKPVGSGENLEFIGRNPRLEGAESDGFALTASGPYAGSAYDRKSGKQYPSHEVAAMAGIDYAQYAAVESHPNFEDKTLRRAKDKEYDTRSLQERGVTAETMGEFGIATCQFEDLGEFWKYPTYLPSGKRGRDRFKWRYPARQLAKNPDKAPAKVTWGKTDEPMPCAYNLLRAKGQKRVYLVGGEVAVWNFYQEGVTAICPFGENRSPVTYREIAETVKKDGTQEICVLLDNDLTGCKAALRALEACREAGVDCIVYDLTKNAKEGYDAADLYEFWMNLEKPLPFAQLLENQEIASEATLKRWEKGVLRAEAERIVEEVSPLAESLIKTNFRKCPQCAKHAILEDTKSKEGGFFCWTSVGGCGAKFPKGHEEIMRQKAEKVDAPTLLLGMVDGHEIYHTDTGGAYVVVEENGHRKTMECEGPEFSKWANLLWQKKTGVVIKREAIREMQAALAARAIGFGPEKKDWLRCAPGDGEHCQTYYLDLCNKRGEMVEIDAEGWRIVTQAPVYFRRPPSMQELPMPVRYDDDSQHKAVWQAFRDCTNLGDDDNFILTVAWMVAALFPRGLWPCPVLYLQGEAGSAKSVTSRLIRDTLDPSSSGIPNIIREERDVAIFAKSLVCAMDNQETWNDWASSLLSSMITGGDYQSRALHTDAGVHTIRGGMHFIMNGIRRVGKEDFLERTINIQIPSIDRPEGYALENEEVRQPWEKTRPGVLAAILDAISECLRHESRTMELRKGLWLPRMSNFTMAIIKAEACLPWDKGEFYRAYCANIRGVEQMALEDSFAQTVIEYIEMNGAVWRESSTVVFNKLLEHAIDKIKTTEEIGRQEALKQLEKSRFPMTPVAVGKRLKQLAPNLRRSAGIDCRNGQDSKGSYWSLYRPDDPELEPGARDADIED